MNEVSVDCPGEGVPSHIEDIPNPYSILHDNTVTQAWGDYSCGAIACYVCRWLVEFSGPLPHNWEHTARVDVLAYIKRSMSENLNLISDFPNEGGIGDVPSLNADVLDAVKWFYTSINDLSRC